MRLAGLLYASETNEGLATGLRIGVAGADAILCVQRDVALYFGDEVGFGAVGSEEAAEAMGDGSEVAHEGLLMNGAG
jgi:hypothetical protein